MENRPSREFDFELPVGYTDEDGQVHRIASLRKMTGHEEALLADRKLRQNAARLVTQLLAACVKRIGEIAPVPRNVISELTSPDRNFLLLQLRRITFGDAIEATYVCPSCGESTRITHDLDEVPVRRLNGEGCSSTPIPAASWSERNASSAEPGPAKAKSPSPACTSSRKTPDLRSARPSPAGSPGPYSHRKHPVRRTATPSAGQAGQALNDTGLERWIGQARSYVATLPRRSLPGRW